MTNNAAGAVTLANNYFAMTAAAMLIIIKWCTATAAGVGTCSSKRCNELCAVYIMSPRSASSSRTHGLTTRTHSIGIICIYTVSAGAGSSTGSPASTIEVMSKATTIYILNISTCITTFIRVFSISCSKQSALSISWRTPIGTDYFVSIQHYIRLFSTGIRTLTTTTRHYSIYLSGSYGQRFTLYKYATASGITSTSIASCSTAPHFKAYRLHTYRHGIGINAGGIILQRRNSPR